LLLLVVGLFLFFTTYAVYGHYLGGINGLPPLPLEYTREAQQNGPVWIPPPDRNLVNRMLEQAFGKDCDEVKKRAIKMEVGSRHLYLAADDFQILPDGRGQFKPFSIAIYGKGTGPGGYPEINTLQADEAVLEFDKPLTNSAEQVGDRKIVAGTLKGNVRIVNNRRTPQRDDDMYLYTPGPVDYQESTHHIWTQAVVKLEDVQSKPEPMRVTATGMDLYLLADERSPRPGAASGRKKKGENISGVETIKLRGDVTMTLFVDSRSGFLGNGGPEAAQAEAPKPDKTSPAAGSPPKSKVVITTQGPFEYDLVHDIARFSISRRRGIAPDLVEVTRFQNLRRLDLRDVLECDELELQFRRKEAAAPPRGQPLATPEGAGDRGVALEIESAHATGTQVTLVSDSEALHAFGNDLYYDARKHETTLTGEREMSAMKEGSLIFARGLRLKGGDNKEAQGATALGPGRLEVLDSKTGTRPLKATWGKELVWSKDGADDVLTLTENASFIQVRPPEKPEGTGADAAAAKPDQGPPNRKPELLEQELDADFLKVWLKQAPASNATSGGQRRVPHHLIANGHVRAQSAEMHVHDTDHMTVWFRDLAPLVGPEPPPAGTDSQPIPPAGSRPGGQPGAAPGASPPAAPATGAPAAPPTQEKPKKPIDVSARSIEAHVLRTGTKNELDWLRCEGTVHVVQEPSGPEDKGTDIRGQTLKIEHFPEGSVLVVTADRDKGPNELAYVQLDQITILGTVVNIDQVQNQAWVDGLGSMKMPTTSNFEGQKLNQPKDLTVHWNERMFFNGKMAEFHGGVIADMDLPEAEKRKLPLGAETEVDHLACQSLQVDLDRTVSLREGEKKGQPPAKVDKLVCANQVRVEESAFRMQKLHEYKRIVSTELDLDNLAGVVDAPGPGIVYIMQMGGKGEDLPVAPSPQKPAVAPKPGEEELKLTRVAYEKHMRANNTTRTAYFLGNVQVIHLPSADPDVPVDITKPLPKGAMYLRCEGFKVTSCRHPDGKTSHQEMEANTRVLVQAPEFWGRADRVTYDESKELVIFEGLNGNMATLYRENPHAPRGQRGEIRSRKIYYWRRTNDFKTEETENLRSD
jgi:hypothetical protein